MRPPLNKEFVLIFTRYVLTVQIFGDYLSFIVPVCDFRDASKYDFRVEIAGSTPASLLSVLPDGLLLAAVIIFRAVKFSPMTAQSRTQV